VAGESFLLTVATQGLAVLAATLAARNGAAWLLIAAIAAAVLGLALYIVTVTRFALRQLLTGHGDQWIAGGALAISALACAKITKADDVLGRFASLHGFLDVSALALWCLAMLLAGTADRGRDAAAQAQLRRTALGHRLPTWHVRRVILGRTVTAAAGSWAAMTQLRRCTSVGGPAKRMSPGRTALAVLVAARAVRSG
jgi:hypothetical protein